MNSILDMRQKRKRYKKYVFKMYLEMKLMQPFLCFFGIIYEMQIAYKIFRQLRNL